MAIPNPQSSIPNPSSRVWFPEIKAGLFLAFCLALFICMFMVFGQWGRSQGRQELRVVFTQVNALRRDSPVRYNGMELGRVKKIKLVQATPELLERLPEFTLRDLPNLPLTEEEQERLSKTHAGQPASDKRVNELVRQTILNRGLVLLVLDVARDGDDLRFRVDDEFRVSGSLNGDSAVEISTGRGTPIAADYSRVFLGTSGDVYSHIGATMTGVTKVLNSLSDVVGGDAASTLKGGLGNFDALTARIDTLAASAGDKIDGAWTDVDNRLERAGGELNKAGDDAVALQPATESRLKSADDAIADFRKGAAEAIGKLREDIKSYRGDVAQIEETLRPVARQYRDSFPEQVKSAREWSERFGPTVEKVDGFLARADERLNKGIESTRTQMGAYVEQGAALEETTFRLRQWPWSFANKSTPEEQEARRSLWRHELARRQFEELRGELARARQELLQSKSAGSGQTAQIERLDRLLSELQALEARPASVPGGRDAGPTTPPRKGKR